MKQWEYRRITMTADEAQLTEFGKQGWELVSVVNLQPGVVGYLKRAIEPEGYTPGQFIQAMKERG